ncbi:MAG: hypothetical protein ABF539_09280 [Liquorilactobacillus nagelii]|uniref:hypothetical protein n=1 Tax=Liquorilactobacillus nagelii TaxID=82688 RepID=UPI0039EBBD20
MAKLKDLINIEEKQDTITIRGVDIPVCFNMQSFGYIEEAYGAGFPKFEADMNKIMSSKKANVSGNMIKIISSLIYAMVRSGGTECTPEELTALIPFQDMESVFKDVMKVFNAQYFDSADGEKIKQEKK